MTTRLPTFTDLPIKHGIGPWDLNRFRIAFRSNRSAADLGSFFTSHFKQFLDSSAATVEQFQDKLKFFGRIDLGVNHSYAQPHPDWVRQVTVQPTRGFTVQTLHRDTPDNDDLVVGAGAVVVALIAQGLQIPVPPVLTAMLAIEVNRHHFLAGRRAWRIDNAAEFNTTWNHPYPADAFILETAAVERISILPFLPIRIAMGMMVPNIWCNLLQNFVQQMQCQVLAPNEWALENEWRRNFNFPSQPHYYMRSFWKENQMTEQSEYHDTLRVHTFLRT